MKNTKHQAAKFFSEYFGMSIDEAKDWNRKTINCMVKYAEKLKIHFSDVMSVWISVDERLPNKNEMCYVWHKNLNCLQESNWNNGRGSWIGYDINEITHWQYKNEPNPPKDK